MAHLENVDLIVASGRSLAGFCTSISRVHVDAQVLTEIAVISLRPSTRVQKWAPDPLIDNYDHARKFRRRPATYGLEQFQELIHEYEHNGSTDWALVESVFQARKRQDQRKKGIVNDNSINIWDRDGAVITGTVINSFNKINERDPALAHAFAEVV